MPRHHIWGRQKGRVSAPHVSGRLAFLSTAASRLPTRHVLLLCAGRVQLFRAGSRRQRGLGPSKRNIREMALNRPQPGMPAASPASDEHTAPECPARLSHLKHRVSRTPTPTLLGSIVPKTKGAGRYHSAGARATKFPPADFPKTGTSTQHLRRHLERASRAYFTGGWHPPLEHTTNFRRRRIPSSCPRGNIQRGTQTLSLRFTKAAAAERARRRGGRRRCLPRLLVEGTCHATYRVHCLQASATGFLTKEEDGGAARHVPQKPATERVDGSGGPSPRYLASSV
ncbi:hypothetical protein HPB50_029306 [Hyalomma asiaticum]|nr:hypothetical protein HPB50_029306 [Hyalomma asiaticum]